MDHFIELDTIAVIAITLAALTSIPRSPARWALLLAVFQVISVGQFLRRHMALERSGVSSRSRTLWFIGSIIMIVTPLFLVWSVFGGMGGATYQLYHFGVAVCLLAALGAFVGFLRLDPRP